MHYKREVSFDNLKNTVFDIGNVVAALVVAVLAQCVLFFATTQFVCFLFFVVIIIWVLAKLMWEGGIHSKTTRMDDLRINKSTKW